MILFYAVTSIVIGILVVIFGILSFKKYTKANFILSLVFGILLIANGIISFFVPENYSYIPILVILANVVALAISYYVLDKKTKK